MKSDVPTSAAATLPVIVRQGCNVLEKLGGSRELSPESFQRPFVRLLYGLWWGLLIAMIAVFSGQTSKFIYIDF